MNAGLKGHHDYVHAFRVGEIARQVARYEWHSRYISQLAGLAGMSHNADRILQKEMGVGRKDIEPVLIQELVRTWIGDAIHSDDISIVTEAVIGHDGVNSEKDSAVLVALMDGDRVVNLDADLFPRSGQFYADLPVTDYEHLLDDPDATYRNPKTVMRDIAYSMEWADPNTPVCVRTRLGKEMVAERVRLFELFFETYKKQLAQEGMHPFPFAETSE